MNWKTVGKIAKWAAIAVVPGAAGYVAYRYVVRPWLDNRAAKNKTALTPPDEKSALDANERRVEDQSKETRIPSERRGANPRVPDP